MLTLLLISLAATPMDEVLPDGTIYRKFDHQLMARITAENAEKRAAKRKYDPVTWLPVEEERPHKSAHAAVVEEERRAARLRMVALRKQKRQQASSVDPIGWIMAPAIPTRPCPWAWLNYVQ